MRVKKFSDLIPEGKKSAEIRCLYKGTIVRRLSRTETGDIRVEPLEGPVLTVSAKTPIIHEPWMMDRGNLVFFHDEMPGQTLKLCGEHDPITFDDGTEDRVDPDPSCDRYQHRKGGMF